VIIISYESEQSLHHFTFYPLSDKPIRVVIHYLSINTSSQDITHALWELGYNSGDGDNGGGGGDDDDMMMMMMMMMICTSNALCPENI
jgi:hypothetical protein